MNSRSKLLAAAALVTVTFALPARADLAPQAAAATITAGASDTAGEASVAVGEHLLVRLPGSAGTGHSWQLASDAGPELALLDQRVEPRTTRVLGGASMQAFEFDAQAAGQKELTFNYMGPGAAEDAAPAKTYVLTVSIGE